jgi:hypothetical protein
MAAVPDTARDSSFLVAAVGVIEMVVELTFAGVPLMLALAGVCEGASPVTGALVDVCASPAEDSDIAPAAGAVPANVAVAEDGTWMDVNVGVVVTEHVEELNVDETPVTTETDWKLRVTDTVPAGVGKVIGMPVAGKVMPVAFSYETVPPVMDVVLSYVIEPPEMASVTCGTDTVPPDIAFVMTGTDTVPPLIAFVVMSLMAFVGSVALAVPPLIAFWGMGTRVKRAS